MAKKCIFRFPGFRKNRDGAPKSGVVPASVWLPYLLPCAVLVIMLLVSWVSSCARAVPPDESPVSEPPGSVSRVKDLDGPRNAPPETGWLPFEENLAAPLADEVRRVDYALVQTMAGLGLPAGNITLAYTEFRHVGDEAYPFQSLRVAMDKKAETFAAALRESFVAWNVRAELFPLRENAYGISVFGHPSHELILRPYDPGAAPGNGPALSSPSGAPARVPWRMRQRAPGETPRMAVVMDDLGESLRDVDTLVTLPFPVTCAIWPDSTHARRAAERAHAAGLEIIVHQPMEPMGYPDIRPGPNALMRGMDAPRIEKLVAGSLGRVPYAVGLNNHMGSRFTRDGALVRPVVEVLAERNLFALDSLTHPASVFYQEARAAGLPALRRDLFLDVDPGVSAVLAQLAKAERMALLTGQVIVIGHPLPGTMQALREWGKIRNREIRMVTLQELLP